MLSLLICVAGIFVPALAATHVRGVPNFRTVNDQVYGGGQPSAEGFRNLAAMGVKTVVDLQEEGGAPRRRRSW